METVTLQATFYNIKDLSAIKKKKKGAEKDQNQEHKWTKADRSIATIRK